MHIVCKTAGPFEDQLTPHDPQKGKGIYWVKELGENSYLITNDKKQDRWYGTFLFYPVII